MPNTQTRTLEQSAEMMLASRYAEWLSIDEDTRAALLLDLVGVACDEDTPIAEAADILHARLTAEGNDSVGVLARYGATLVTQYRKDVVRAAALHAWGFDTSSVTPDGVRARCSACNATVINGHAAHEHGCSNAHRAEAR